MAAVAVHGDAVTPRRKAPHWSAALVQLHACHEAVAWAKRQPTYAKAWSSCRRADWLLWLAGRTDADRAAVVLAACACARTALPHVRAGELRPLRAIETAEAWCRGEATIEQVREARRAAAAVCANAANAAAANAADAAVCAADARSKALASMAPLVRLHIKRPSLPKVMP